MVSGCELCHRPCTAYELRKWVLSEKEGTGVAKIPGEVCGFRREIHPYSPLSEERLCGVGGEKGSEYRCVSE